MKRDSPGAPDAIEGDVEHHGEEAGQGEKTEPHLTIPLAMAAHREEAKTGGNEDKEAKRPRHLTASPAQKVEDPGELFGRGFINGRRSGADGAVEAGHRATGVFAAHVNAAQAVDAAEDMVAHHLEGEGSG